MSEQTIFPTLRYQDAPAAIEWLGRAFGFEPRMVVDGDVGVVAHAELTYGQAMIMLGSIRPPVEGEWSAVAPPAGSGSMYVVVDDIVDAHHGRRHAFAGG